MTQIRLSHPRRARLREWLDGGDDERITQHVDQCDRCARTLEELSAESDDAVLVPERRLGDAIRAAMPTPADLNERVLQRVEARRRAEREISLFLGLISIPRDAVDLMMPPERREEWPPRAYPPVRPDTDPEAGHHREELE